MSSDKNNQGSYLKPLISILSALGIIVSLYLTYIHFTEGRAAFCTAGSDCDTVRQSGFSMFMGIPVAAVGVAGYSVIFIASLLGIRKRTKWLVLYILALIGFVFSLYLTYIELFVIKAICMYCIFSAVLMTVIF
ncbi:MAG TPA: vitamin K epoxide reductase family protein, partial [Thermodesulfobacteriota bacterium]|nr:vitamin K epoxide reductase family protein [Thermodesulfobacteriota bacterium]